jgi:hypothetical protein
MKKLLCVLVASLGCACQAFEPAPSSAEGDPAKGEVALGSRAGWDAFLLLDTEGVGVWGVEAFQVFEQFGSPEVVALDDQGRCNVLVSYSGSWTPLRAVHDGRWLGPSAHGDIDPAVPGRELYVGGQRGNVYQVVGHRSAGMSSRVVAELPGHEIHTLVAGDLQPERPGMELLVFTRPGAMCFLRPSAQSPGFEVEWLGELPGRVRDAVVLPAVGGEAPWIATVSRAGRVELLRFTRSGPEWQTVHAEEMGFGRIALRPAQQGPELVLYTTSDDGRVLRHERGADNGWSTSLVYAGPQGPRGLVAGALAADPAVESLIVFGYSGKVQQLSRGADAWSVETIFQDTDRGHWLALAELDGRNESLEILCSGYAGRVVMLARPPVGSVASN